MYKYLLVLVGIINIQTQVFAQVSLRWEVAYPGIWKASIGKSEKLTLLSAAQIHPNVSALEKLPVTDFPVSKADISYKIVDHKVYLPLVKWFLAIPLYVMGIIYLIYGLFLTAFAWFSILFSGKYPVWCADAMVGILAFYNRVYGYAFILVTDEYPSFSL